jgi:hypothetical protein
MQTLRAIPRGLAAANDRLERGASLHAAPSHQPLIIDLDHTLFGCDLPGLLLRRTWHREPLSALGQLLACALRAPGKVSSQAAARGPACLSVHGRTLYPHANLLALAERECRRPRPVVGVSAMPELLARRIAGSLDVLGEVIAGEGNANADPSERASLLQSRYPQGFIYAGSRPADLAVWAYAQGAVGVDLQPHTAKLLAQLGKPMMLVNSAPADRPTVFGRFRFARR